jgi:hypothetical protein
MASSFFKDNEALSLILIFLACVLHRGLMAGFLLLPQLINYLLASSHGEELDSTISYLDISVVCPQLRPHRRPLHFVRAMEHSLLFS